MVGREAERALFSARMDDLVTGGDTATLASKARRGSASRGSSPRRSASRGARGVRVLAAAADPVESATSYYAWRSIFTDAARRHARRRWPTRTPCTCRATRELRRLRPLLSSIVPVGIPDNELTGRDGRQRARGEHQAAARLDPAPHDGAGARADRRRGRPLAGLELVGAAAGDRAVGAAGPDRGDHAADGRPARAVRAAAGAGVDRGPRAGAAEPRRDPHARQAAARRPRAAARAHRLRGRPRRRAPVLLRAAGADACARAGSSGCRTGPPWSATSTPSTSRPPSRAPSSAASTGSRRASCCA